MERAELEQQHTNTTTDKVLTMTQQIAKFPNQSTMTKENVGHLQSQMFTES